MENIAHLANRKLDLPHPSNKRPAGNFASGQPVGCRISIRLRAVDVRQTVGLIPVRMAGSEWQNRELAPGLVQRDIPSSMNRAVF